MKEALVGAFFLLRCTVGLAQETFNVVYDLGLNTLGMCIMEKDEGYLTASLVLDTLDGYYLSIRIAGINSQGQVEFVNQIGSPDKEYSISSDANLTLHNGEYLIAGHTYDSDLGIAMACVFWLNEFGDTLKTLKFASPYAEPQEIDDNSFIVPTYLATDSLGNRYVSCQIANNITANDFMIQQILPNGELGWQYVYATPADPDLCFALAGTSDGVVAVCSGTLSGDPPTRYSRCFEISHDNIFHLFYDHPDVLPVGHSNDFVLEPDGIVIATEILNNEWNGFVPYLYKVDYDGNELWSNTLSQYGYHTDQWGRNMVATNDGGYLMVAQLYESLQNDTLNGDYNWNAWMVKFDHEGVIQWERFFHYVESTQDQHLVYDLKATQDGGYIFCGEATDLCIAPDCHNSQQGWLVKVDGCGCLVPGCDPNCSTDTTDYSFEHYFIAGPNPFSQYLNLYISENLELDGIYQIQLYDMSGRLVNEFSFSNNRITYMWNLNDIANGNYVLSLRRGDEILQVENVIKR